MAALSRKVFRRSLYGAVALAGSQALLLHRQPCWREAAFQPAPAGKKHPEAHPNPHAKTAVVIGAGVAGISTAYALSQRGFQVLVLDARDKPAGKGSSSAAAAGGMDMVHKFSTANDWLKMFRQLLPFQSGYTFFYVSWLDVMGDFFFWRWLARYASESLFASDAHIQSKSDRFLPIVSWGIEETIRVMRVVPGLAEAAHFSEAGSVKVEEGDNLAGYGLKAKVSPMTNESAQAFEPMLATSNQDTSRSFMVNHDSRFGECESFTKSLAQHCQDNLPVRIACDTSIQGFDRKGERVVGVHTSRGHIAVGDGVVAICGGAWSGVICDMLDVFCPIYPLKGYTLLVDAKELSRLVYNNYVYAVPAGPRVRVASIAGLGGWNVDVDASLEAALRREGAHLLPGMAEQVRSSEAVSGLRPFAADEVPLVGRIPGISNVLLNTGPGHTGWKCSSGFAAILAAVADGQDPASESLPDLPDSSMLDPAGRLGTAFTGPSILRNVGMRFSSLLGTA